MQITERKTTVHPNVLTRFEHKNQLSILRSESNCFGMLVPFILARASANIRCCSANASSSVISAAAVHFPPFGESCLGIHISLQIQLDDKIEGHELQQMCSLHRHPFSTCGPHLLWSNPDEHQSRWMMPQNSPKTMIIQLMT